MAISPTPSEGSSHKLILFAWGLALLIYDLPIIDVFASYAIA